MMKKLALVLALGCIGLVPQSAQAQFSTLDMQDGARFKGGAQLDFTFPSDSQTEGGLLRTNLYVGGGAGTFGGYVNLPFTTTHGTEDNELHFGNLELGAVANIGLAMLDLTVRLGVTLPTAEKSLSAMMINASGSYGRLTDLVQSVPGTMAVRVSISPQLELGILYARADVGFDFVIPTSDEAYEGSSGLLTVKPKRADLIRLNAAIGVRLAIVGISLEFSNIGNLHAEEVQGGGDTFAHTLGIGVRLSTPIIKPYATFVMPLNDGLRGEFYVLTIGLNANI